MNTFSMRMVLQRGRGQSGCKPLHVLVHGGDVPGTAVRYMETKIMEYVAKQQCGMLGGRTHIKVEDDEDEEEEPEPKN